MLPLAEIVSLKEAMWDISLSLSIKQMTTKQHQTVIQSPVVKYTYHEVQMPPCSISDLVCHERDCKAALKTTGN